MTNSSIDNIRNKMNLAGQTGTPFLFAFDFELTDGFFLSSPLQQTEVFFQIRGRGNKDLLPSESPQTSPLLSSSPLSASEYKKKFDRVSAGLQQGDSYLTNLTLTTPITLNYTLTEIFKGCQSPYQLFLPGKFVCFSPESFVRIEKEEIFTYPMKGTIQALRPNACEKILNDPKETAEHSTVVDLLRNDLSKVARRVEVKRFRYIDRLRANGSDLLQVSSEIAGKLEPYYLEHFGDLILELLPAGSVSGAPKKATLQIIRETERKPRGYYSGVFGYFDGKRLDSGVLIRFIEEKEGRFFYRSGGGITAQSSWESEYQEAIDKIYIPVE